MAAVAVGIIRAPVRVASVHDPARRGPAVERQRRGSLQVPAGRKGGGGSQGESPAAGRSPAGRAAHVTATVRLFSHACVRAPCCSAGRPTPGGVGGEGVAVVGGVRAPGHAWHRNARQRLRAARVAVDARVASRRVELRGHLAGDDQQRKHPGSSLPVYAWAAPVDPRIEVACVRAAASVSRHGPAGLSRRTLPRKLTKPNNKNKTTTQRGFGGPSRVVAMAPPPWLQLQSVSPHWPSVDVTARYVGAGDCSGRCGRRGAHARQPPRCYASPYAAVPRCRVPLPGGALRVPGV